MTGLLSKLFDSPKEKARKKADAYEAKMAYGEAYSKGLIKGARKRGLKEGVAAGYKPKSRFASTMDALENIGQVSNQATDFLVGDLPGYGSLGGGFGPRPTRRKSRKHKKGKTITIHVK